MRQPIGYEREGNAAPTMCVSQDSFRTSYKPKENFFSKRKGAKYPA